MPRDMLPGAVLPGEILIDVSDLEPPEPLLLTLEAAEQLKAGEYVRMLHRRDPCMLYAKLEENNFQHRQQQGKSSAVELFIWRKGDIEAEAAINKVLVA